MKDTPPPPPEPVQPTPTVLDQNTMTVIQNAQITNVIKKMKAGKVLSKAELEMLSANQAPKGGPPMLVKSRKGRKPTTKQITDRVDLVGQWLALRRTKTEIHNEVATRWGCHWRTADNYIVRARQAALERLKKPKEEHLADAIAFNEAVLSSPETEWKDKIAANKDKSELIGLYPPKGIKTEVSGPDGGAMEIRHVRIVVESSIDPEEVTGPAPKA